MDKEIINILKKHGCLYMAEDYKELLTDIEKHYKQSQALQLLQPDVMQSVLFANWIVEKGYKLNNKPFGKGCDAVWFFDKKSTGSTTSELYNQYISETVA
jgi:hypothetical protein